MNLLEINNRFSFCDYLLVLQPHEDLFNKIMQVKQKFAETYDCAQATHSKPHITLVNFRQYEINEERMIQAIRSVAVTHKPFSVELNNFGSFPTHTIFINVATKTQIVHLVKSFRPVQRLMKMNDDNKPHFITDPHMTVSRKLLPWQYEKGWLELSNSHFNGKFVADYLLLLKRKDGSWKYSEAARFSLLNKPIATIRQGSLFAAV
jgi:2'-5' RNA ligase